MNIYTLNKNESERKNNKIYRSLTVAPRCDEEEEVKELLPLDTQLLKAQKF